MSRIINVAIIGAGIGGEHLDAYRQLADRFRVRTVCDLDKERAASIVGSDDIAIETDVESVLVDPKIELVDVCLPPHLHFKNSFAALNAGKHVICEKPLATSLQDVDALADAAARANRKLFPVFQYRYGPAMVQLKALVAAGVAGKPFAASLETHWNRDAEYYAVPWRGTWAGEQGGAVLGHAIHNHDLLMHIMGPVARLSAMTTTRVNDIETEDCAAITFEMENGAVATSSITLGASTDTTRLRVCFEGLTAQSGTAPYAPANDIWTFQARDPEKQNKIDAVLASVPTRHFGFTGFLEAIADCLNGAAGNEVSVLDGRRSIELVTAVYHAAKLQSSISLPLGSDTPYYDGWLPSQEIKGT
ncbi:MAG: Gfo/Idh/MocA family oxidoreductase [Hyphomicrobiales bacterium]